jgi:hypothetical protein
MATAQIGAAASMEFVVGMTAAANDEYKLPVTRPQGGQLDDTSRPDGLGKSGGSESVKTPSTQYDYSQRPNPRRKP